MALDCTAKPALDLSQKRLLPIGSQGSTRRDPGRFRCAWRTNPTGRHITSASCFPIRGPNGAGIREELPGLAGAE